MRTWILLSMVVLVSACGDSDGGSTPCLENMVPGQSVGCECEDGAEGTRTCQEDETLTKCDCSGGPPTAGTTGMTGDGDGDGDTPVVGDGDGDGDGDTTIVPEEDAGTGDGDGDGDGDTGDGDGDGDSAGPPTDGNQLSLCSSVIDCNKGFNCYTTGAGQGFCSETCNADADCEHIAGATYTCASEGICRVVCEGPMDSSCPAGMECLPAGGGMFPGAGFRCKWPDSVGNPDGKKAFEQCQNNMDCMGGLTCINQQGFPIPGGSQAGYCTKTCNNISECTDEPPAGGSISVTCDFTSLAGQQACVLNCTGNNEGCPDGMACVGSPPFQRCGYN